MTNEEIESIERGIRETIRLYYAGGDGASYALIEHEGARLAALAAVARLSVPSGDVANDVDPIARILTDGSMDCTPEERAEALDALSRLVARLQRSEKEREQTLADWRAYKAMKDVEGARLTEAADTALTKGYDDGTEAMRAACWEAIQRVCEEQGLTPFLPRFKVAIEGATT